jgi:hypothetical protein
MEQYMAQGQNIGGLDGLAAGQAGANKLTLNFAGGEYGVRNDIGAEEIARKYGLSVDKRNPQGSIPNYILTGNITPEILSKIQGEKGIGFAEMNLPQYNWSSGPMPSAMTSGTMQNFSSPIVAQPRQQQSAANINQAMQTYQNLVGQGMANMQAQNVVNQFGRPMQSAQSPRKNISTSFGTPPIQAF